jgi:two-component system cell cycle sensor histidine kinase/response regulator CckA
MNRFAALYVIVCILSFAISIGVGVWCALRRGVPGARAYSFVALVSASWTLGLLLELQSMDLAGKVFWDNFQFGSMAGFSLSLIIFALTYTNRQPARPLRLYSLLALPLVAMVILAFTDPWHGLMRPGIRLVPGQPFSALLYEFSPTLLVFSAYCYSLFLACVAILAIAYKHSQPFYRTHIGLVTMGSSVIVLGTLLTVTVLSDLPERDLTPLTFIVSNLLIFWGLFRYRLFDVVPVARETVIESLPDSVYIIDANNRLVDLNPIAAQLIGQPSSQLIGRSVESVFAPWRELLGPYLDITGVTLHELAVEVERGLRQIELRIQPIYDQRGRYRGRVVLARDITERKHAEQELRRYRDQLERLVDERTAELRAANERLEREIAERKQVEAQLYQARKLEAIGRMAGNIAHDFNNTLMVISSSNELLFESSAGNEELLPDILAIRAASAQAGGLIRQLLAFSRKQELQPTALNLHDLIPAVRPLLERLISSSVQLQVELRSIESPIVADTVQLQQVLMNLVINANDAMPAGGALLIETDNLELDALFVEQCIGLRPGPYVLLAVSDTGTGMSREVQQQLFEPFFTTKGPGKGTGLGLAVVHGIIKQSGGEITAYSLPGLGTTFKIYLPLAGLPTAPAPAQADPRGAGRWDATILLVDDDEASRLLMQRVLQSLGCRVLAASSYEEAVDLCAYGTATINLLIADFFVAQARSGPSLASTISDLHPLAQVIYLSGATRSILAFHQLGKDTPLLTKPFTYDMLTRLIRKVLEQAPLLMI